MEADILFTVIVTSFIQSVFGVGILCFSHNLVNNIQRELF
jgi:hypothetical protein